MTTIVLVHGAFAESASWDRVIQSLGGSGHDVIADSFNDVFCQDLPAPEVALPARTQRLATQEALTEVSGESSLWQDVPSWFLIGDEDRIIPPALQRFMADRGGARRTFELPGASHAAPVSIARLIVEAATPLRAAA